EPTWALQGQWLITECKHTIYHMYVKDVENQETVTLYNDIGRAYNYKTVGIGNTAFHNKDKIKTIKFQDLYADASEMYATMAVTIPDSAFLGCTSLETLDLIMRSIDTNPDRDVALGPENFILCGEDIFVGCDTTKLKIRIAAEKYEEFAENPVWGKYKNCFEVVDVPEVVDFTEYGAQYSYSFENNALKKQGYTGGHTIEHLHVIGQDVDGLENQEGEVGLFNDIGVSNNYKLDYVKEKAFYGSQELKGISMFDLKGAGVFGDAYTDLEVVLQDSAFANCPNLEHINMLYFRTDGTNSVEPMSPSRVMLGDGVFAGSDKFKVKMVTTAVDEFKTDTAWAKYEERFLPSFILTKDKALMAALEECGMEYESPITGGGFDIYDVMKVTGPAMLDGKFQGKAIAEFRDFKAFECINLGYIGEAWFKDCDKLQAIELPSTIDIIGAQAFYNCQMLDDLVIPASVSTISHEAFANCKNLKSITFLSNSPAILIVNNVFDNLPEDYVIYVPEEAVETYKEYWSLFADHIQSLSNKHTGIYEVTLTEPGTLAEALGITITGTDPLTISGNYSKYDSLKIVGPINGTDVGVVRFMGGRDVNNCDDIYPRNLKYLDLYDAHIKAGGADYNQDGSNDRITEDDCIDTYMFWELDALETLILPKSVTKIKDYAFNNCNALRRLVIGDNTKSIGEEVTHDSPKLQEVIMLCNEVPATDGDAWAEEKNIKVFYVPNAIREHLSGSRVYYTRGDSISSPFVDDAVMHAMAGKRIYTIADIAGLTDFENVVNGNTAITKFNELMFAVGVTRLGDNSLSGCSKLEEVALPCNVDTITAGAFRGCTSLNRINVTCDTIPALAPDALEDLPGEFVIYVQPGKEEDYRKAWPQYANHIQGFKQQTDEVKVVTVTEPGTLGEALGFTVNMDSPNNVGRIGGDLISIKALKVNGPINGKDIAVLRMLGGRDEEDGDEVALARMTYLDLYDATICTDPNNICFNRDGTNDYVENDNEIPEYMFWKLDKLQTVILPKNVTKIDDNAFYDNIGIETIVVGDATTYIGNDAFGECKNLKNIIFLGNEKAELDGDAFTDPITDQPYKVEKMYIPLGLYRNYVADAEYTTHTKEFCTNFDDDDLFRAYGSRLVITTDQLQSVTNVDGWFDYHTGIKDLTSLELTAVDSLKNATLTPLTELEKITLPATLAVVENNAFAANTKLQWADFAQCTNEGMLTQDNIGNLGFNEHAIIYAPESFTATGLTNVVYGSEGNLRCDMFVISDKAAYEVPREFKAAAISYDRLFKQGETTTLYLPFDMELP
ncbi:MAG: leucine-rich repeat protein, partial [Bacteroidaceae bacterium]|nr:leucine-rich repeat protein [Bacteroidaceae bacterium]